MINLDEIEEIKALDKSNLYGSIEAFGKQCQQAWDESKSLIIPPDFRNVKNIVINGMGGSGIGPDFVKRLFSDRLTVPLEVINSFTLPNYVDENTLYIMSSYSGTTEEVIDTLSIAKEKKAKLLGITTGAELKSLMDQEKITYFLINPINNPCNQPRMGLGYSIVGIMGLLKQAGVLEVSEEEISEIINCLEMTQRTFNIDVLQTDNLAKKLSSFFYGKIPVLVAAEFLEGSIHSIRNHFNENSKNYADYFVISEINHHLMEGLAFPPSNPQNLMFFFVKSDLYTPQIQKRFFATKNVVEKYKITTCEYDCFSRSKISQAFEVLNFGEFVNFYLAMLNGIDPTPIPWVDYFKELLTK